MYVQVHYILYDMMSILCVGVLVGAVVIHDKLKPEASKAVKCLQSMGLRVALLTGDNRRTALAIADAVSGVSASTGVHLCMWLY